MLKKYFTIIKTEIDRQFTYRISILGFVAGNFLELFAPVIVWTAVFENVSQVRGYTYEEMISYIVVGWIFMFITTNYEFEKHLAREIQLGTLSGFIVKPISYLKYTVAVSSGRVVIAFLIVLAQSAAYVLVFHEHIIFIIGWLDALMLLIMLGLGFFIKLFFSYLIGMAAFWTTEINGIYKGFNIMIKFLSGAYFPMNLLPVVLVNISLAFPFVYTFFVPVQLYLGKISRLDGLKAIGIEVLWLFALYAIIKLVWYRGLKKYESVGI